MKSNSLIKEFGNINKRRVIAITKPQPKANDVDTITNDDFERE